MADLKSKIAGIAPKKKDAGSKAGERLMALLHGKSAPHGTSGPLGERGYSFLKAVAYAKGAVAPEGAKEEIETHNQLRALYAGADWGFGGKSFLIPFDTASIPVGYDSRTLDPDPKRVEFVNTLKAKIAAATKGYDPDEAAWLRQKMGTKNVGTLTDTGLGSLIPFPVLGELVEIQRNREIFARCGAREIPLPPSGRMALPKQTGTV